MTGITTHSNQAWIDRFPLKLERYLRRNHRIEDRLTVCDLIYNYFPVEGKKLIQNFDLSPKQKKQIFLGFIYFQPQITCGVFADQRMGKDATICEVFTELILLCRDNDFIIPRFVTLGNIKCPPFVFDGFKNIVDNILCGLLLISYIFEEDSFSYMNSPSYVKHDLPHDMYFSFKNIPSASGKEQIFIYCSEIETVLPARDGKAPENALFAQLEGTLAQNHQKLFGACKLASKVDINFIRGQNCKIFKFIDPEKLNIEGVERDNIISELGMWHLPKDRNNKRQTLLTFDSQLFLVDYDLPFWWSDDYSEQFRNVPDDKIKEYIEVMFSNGMKVQTIQIAIAQKFRRDLSVEQIETLLGG
jgi:hypothetical protein